MGMQMLSALLSDIDGTLVVSNDAHAKAWADALRQFGYDVPAERVRRLIGMGGDKILKRIDEKLNEEEEPGKSIEAVRLQIFLDRYVAGLEPTPGAVALLEQLGSRGILRVAATSANEKEFEEIAAVAGIAGYIDLATTSDDAARSKPDADIVQAALDKAKAGARDALYLGDTPYDIEAAHRAGVRVIALQCGGWSAGELAAAEAVYETPADLLAHFESILPD